MWDDNRFVQVALGIAFVLMAFAFLDLMLDSSPDSVWVEVPVPF